MINSVMSKYKNKIFTIIILVSFLLYIFCILSLMFFIMRSRSMYYSTNFVPFKTVLEYITRINENTIPFMTAFKNLAGNIFLFSPFGFYLPFFIKKLRKLAIFSCFFVVMITILEVLQLVTMRGSFDIDDIILNTLGALFGFLIFNYTPLKKLHKLCSY